MQKKVFNTNELFNGKTVPAFIKSHPVFNSPIKHTKVFSSIGLSNFTEDTNISKCLVDVKKEGSYAWNILLDISNDCSKAKDLVKLSSEKTQFLAPLAERLAQKSKLNEIAQVTSALNSVAEWCNPRSAVAFHPTNGICKSNEGKLDLRLHADIVNGEGKVIHKKNLPIFRLYQQLRTKCIELGVPETEIRSLESLESYKIFSKENIPNKKYQIVFSSDGPDGAWDILTMSMRGIRSCQRWEGEYPKCLIGSIASKFVGIVYLTSGVSAESTPEWGSLGTKMMRRCVVRYACDKDADKPCLIMDKMYPAEDEEILKVFTDTLSKKSGLEVHYGPKLGNKTRHLYIPNEKLSAQILRREWTYQDTALRTKYELDAYVLTNSQTETDKLAARIQSNLTFYLTSKFEDIDNGDVAKASPELRKTISNFALATTYASVAEGIVQNLFSSFRKPNITEYHNTRSFNKAYLRACMQQRKELVSFNANRINNLLQSFCSRKFDNEVFCASISDMIAEFAKQEITQTLRK